MSVWAIVFIVITIALVVGPVAMLRPSKRDSRLSHLRQMAAQKGIRVRLASFALSGKEQEVAVYSRSFERSDTPHAQWQLIEQAFSHELHFHQRWDWTDKTCQAASAQQPQLIELLDTLDNSIVALEITDHSVAVYWLEKRIGIEQIDALLVQLQTHYT